MKSLKKIATARLLVIILLLAVCMAGCAAPAEPNSGVPSETDAPAESDGSGAPADAPQALTLPILDEIDADVAVGTAGSSLLAVQATAKLLDWGVNTGLDTDEIGTAASVWLSAKNEDRTECLQKLELVDDAYQKLLTDEARELLDDAGCAEVEITWGSEPVEPVEAIMRSAGLRDADSGDDAAWDVAGFEKSLLENYGVTPHHYEDLGDGVYQVYVEIDGEIIPFVTVDSAGFNEREAIDLLEVLDCRETAAKCHSAPRPAEMFEALAAIKRETGCPRLQLHMFGLYMTMQNPDFPVSPEANRQL